MPAMPATVGLQFSHVHMYCDTLQELQEYKRLERKLNAFVKSGKATAQGGDTASGRAAWLGLGAEHGDPVTGPKDPNMWVPTQQDVVEQMLVGLGWRVTGVCNSPQTKSFVVTSADSNGVKFVVSAHKECKMDALAEKLAAAEPEAKRPRQNGDEDDPKDLPEYFSAESLCRFAENHVGRAGVAVLGFTTPAGGVDKIHAAYSKQHPKLLLRDSPLCIQGAKILEVCAYYKGEKSTSDADRGTLLRFVEYGAEEADFWVLPGIKKVDADYDGVSMPAYCDHWVSNVVSREGFLDTLHETLGFTPKVDFNAGVVAAGEAQIESTVTGNDPGKTFTDSSMGLQDQSQVYLPINNALSKVGHVHLYLEELGQGIQHIASRVADLPSLVQRANDFRKMTGAGLSFLSIPRSYYGTLTAKQLSESAGMEADLAEQCVAALRDAGIVDSSESVALDATLERVRGALPEGTSANVAEHVLRARYGNLYKLLRDHITEATYLSIVRNNILVDVQGDDLLLQIFTTNVLKRADGDEAPFLEFIQRVCSERVDAKTGKAVPMKPGCGGFGIRNFLTLFLSIEVSKATKLRAQADASGDTAALAYYTSMVEAFTAQLEESNPVLTTISDAMTAEGEAQERGDAEAIQKHAAEKAQGQQRLQEISAKYNSLMKALREKAPGVASA